MATTTIAVRVEPELREALLATARLNGRTIAQEHRLALLEWTWAHRQTLDGEAPEAASSGRSERPRETATLGPRG